MLPGDTWPQKNKNEVTIGQTFFKTIPWRVNMTGIAKATIIVLATLKHLASETKFAIVAKEEIANSWNTAILFTLLLFVDVTLDNLQ